MNYVIKSKPQRPSPRSPVLRSYVGDYAERSTTPGRGS